ncbi:hypothetical protein F5Y01DRAFT_298363 [Xylaria sp. FL0043]|nr:hypothetical protein F5Y01DRAFT_298363 [Xylaria sp. FL0043]
MDDAAEAQRRIEARAVGRTPEEHAALERALERRRRRDRLSHASPVITRPAQQHQQHHHHHHPSQHGNEDDGHARFQPLGANGFEGRAEDDREASPPAEVPKYLHEVDDSEIYSIFKIIHAEVESPSWVSQSSFYFDYAMFRAKVAAAKSGPTPPALGIPPGRKSKPAPTMRNVRGAGWHKRGYRDYGMMWINVREGSYGHTRGMDASENETLTSFVRSVFNKLAGGEIPHGLVLRPVLQEEVCHPVACRPRESWAGYGLGFCEGLLRRGRDGLFQAFRRRW